MQAMNSTEVVMHKLKILYYNWTDFEDERQRGGGVSIYQQNLIDAARQRGDEVWFLSSGACYSPFSRRPFLREAKAQTVGVRKFEIVNSTLIGPGREAFGQDVAGSPEMESLFAGFLSEHGPFDVVHFNNLEGIPVSFLRVAREHYPSAKILYSMHNYFAFCPQVNLWFQDRAACRDFRDGRKCVNCLIPKARPRSYQRVYQFEYILRKLGIPPLSAVDRFLNRLLFVIMRSSFHWLMKAYGGAGLESSPLPITLNPYRPTPPLTILDVDRAAHFASRRRLFVTALNTYIDHILAVSRRVAELAIGFGIDPAKLQVLNIGTRFAEEGRKARRRAGSRGGRGAPPPHTNPSAGPKPAPPASGSSPLHIAYLGYMRRDKGFYFFLNALEKMPAALASRLAVTFAAKIASMNAYQRIQRMAHRFAAVTIYNGYTHSQLRDIHSNIDLVVVPVLWEDNLPQVAMESVAFGIPVLTSNLGGAQELLGCRELVFRAGDREDFYDKLQGILMNPAILSTALASCARLYTPREHYEILRGNFYRVVAPDAAPKESGRSEDESRMQRPMEKVIA
jgi:glycosyltransferase involved in cell wall biosynthesis